MKIAVDGMGGDYAPQAIVEGAVLAAQESKTDIILVGDEARLERELERLQAAQLAYHHLPCGRSGAYG